MSPSAGSGARWPTFRVPMAVVTIGGVLVAAVFTLFLIPVIYTKLDRFGRAPGERKLDRPESLAGGG